MPLLLSQLTACRLRRRLPVSITFERPSSPHALLLSWLHYEHILPPLLPRGLLRRVNISSAYAFIIPPIQLRLRLIWRGHAADEMAYAADFFFAAFAFADCRHAHYAISPDAAAAITLSFSPRLRLRHATFRYAICHAAFAFAFFPRPIFIRLIRHTPPPRCHWDGIAAHVWLRRLIILSRAVTPAMMPSCRMAIYAAYADAGWYADIFMPLRYSCWW